MTDKTKLKLLVDNFNFKLLSIIYDYGRFEVASNPIVIKTKDNL